jgi:hypothetical protein
MKLSRPVNFLFDLVGVILLSAIIVFPSHAQHKGGHGEGIRFNEKNWADILQMARQQHNLFLWTPTRFGVHPVSK